MTALSEPRQLLTPKFQSALRAAFMTSGQGHTDHGRMPIGRSDFVEAVLVYLYDFTKTHLHEIERESLGPVVDEAIRHAERVRQAVESRERASSAKTRADRS